MKVPLCVEVLYRALLCRIIDPKFEHTSFFTFFSAILFSASHYINFYRLEKKYEGTFAFKTSCRLLPTQLYKLRTILSSDSIFPTFSPDSEP
jgi:hypothetical protein